MTQQFTRRFFLTTAIISTTVLTPLPLSSAHAESVTLEEVVVTARKRAESLQDVPLSITAFDSEGIERADISDIGALSLLTPGLSFSDPFGRLNPTAAMRGMSNPGIGEEQMVGFFLDGVYISGRSSLNMLLTDLERIEVTRGPQGALYGRNTFAGAINFVTKDASDVFRGDIEATLGTKSRYEVKASLEGPLSDTFRARLGLIHHSWGGFYENDNPDGVEIGDQETTAGNLLLAWTPTEDMEIKFRLLASHDEDRDPAAFLIPANSENGGFYTGVLPEESPDGYNYGAESTGFERDSLRMMLFLTRDINDQFTLEANASYTNEDIFYNYDADLLPVYFWVWEQDTDREDMSADMRLNYSSSDGATRGLIGASWYKFENALLDNLFLPGFGQTPPGILSVTETRSYSVYGSLTHDVTDRLEVTGELRYLIEEGDFSSDLKDAFGVPLDLKDDWDSILPRASVSYRIQDGLLTYVSAAKGFKSGGFNSSQNVFDDERTYDPESNWTYELGVKASLLDRRLNINADVFYVDWKDQQISTASLARATANTFVTNAAATEITGIEIELAARLTPELSLNLGYSLADATFEKNFDVALAALPTYAPDGDVSGNQLPRQSKHQANGLIQYERPVTLGTTEADWYVRAEFTYQSSQYSTAANLAETGDATKVNLKTGIIGEGFELDLWVKNLLDDRTAPVGIRFVDATNRFGNGFFARAWQVTPADGRTFGLTLRYRFGEN